MKFFSSAFLVAVFSATLLAQGTNTQLVGTMNIHAGGYSNCWGYVANGREYAILGCISGTSIVDITSDTLREVAFIPGIRSQWREMKVYQHYAYVVTEGTGAGEGVQIIDLGTLPDSARLVNTYKPNASFHRAHTVSQEKNYLYLNGGDYQAGGTIVCDLTDPVNPLQIGEYETKYIHDCVVVNDIIYAAEIYGIGLDIIDARSKKKINRITLVQYPGAGTHNTAVSFDGKYVFTTDEIGTAGTYLRVWDKTDLNDVRLAGTYQAAPNTIIHNIHIKGTIAYISYYTEGLKVVDIKNPTIPVEIASYDTYPGSSKTYNGAWGTFPYYTSNKVIISDIQSGLYVVRFPGQDGSLKVARMSATVRDSSTGNLLSDVTVEVAGSNKVLTSDLAGTFSYGTMSDSITLRFSKGSGVSGYQTKTVRAALKYDSTIALNFLMQPNFTNAVADANTEIPSAFSLQQNFPNPFNPTTKIKFRIADIGLQNGGQSAIENRKSKISLKVFDVLGREVVTLVYGELNPGEHSVVYDAKGLPSGVYFYRLSAGSYSETKKMLIAK